LFHDIIYEKKEETDILKSCSMFINSIDFEFNKEHEHILQMIVNTKHHKSHGDKLSKLFNKFDMKILYSDFKDLLEYEKQIFKEYQFVSYNVYKKNRIEFLKNHIEKNKNIKKLINYINFYKPNIGIYAGTFNPFHVGHLNILKQAEQFFDKVIVAQLPFIEKITYPLPSSLYNEILDSNKSLSELVEMYPDATFIRGLRFKNDFNVEEERKSLLKKINKNIKMIYFFYDKEYKYITSYSIRENMQSDKEFVNKLIIK